MEDDDVSVRVALRIRPQIPREIIDMCRICTSVAPGEPQVTLGSDKAFTYNYVFDTPEAQETVYETCVSSLVDSSLEGYNATVLAYGQTGSGKTYTMGTGFDVEILPKEVGIIPRAIQHLFDGIHNRIQTAKENGILPPEFKVMAQFMELYNEEVIDLFNPTQIKGKGFKIHEDPDGGIHVKGVTTKSVLSAEDALQCLRIGALSRTTASTQMNTQSSRSHAIFTLHIKQQRLVANEEEEGNEFETLTAKFHFVDLAGSERLKRTGATGDRAKEGISINCGLLALGNVISALGDKSKRALHVPYRDSKLTRLLQDSLGGNSQTVMIACISPSDRDFMETLNTLKYANRARNIKNRVMINQDKSSRTIVQLRQQIAQLQLELVEYKQGKRMLNEDGTETVNDMFYENSMLQSELNNLRTRVKAMQETIDALTVKNTTLLTEKATGSWIGDNLQGDNHSVTDMVQSYLKEIQDLQAKLMESNSMCEQLRKQSHRVHDTTIHSNMSFEERPAILEEAKRELEKEKELLEKVQRSEIDSESSDSGDDSEHDSDHEQLEAELLNLTTDIDMKQKLIEELELSQRRLQTMRQHYEEKLIQLQTRIRDTQDERDKVLQSYGGQLVQPTEKMKKVKDEYERKLTDMQKELKRLQAAQKEHARLLRNQTQHETQLRSFKNELSDMKRAKVKLINKMKEESQRHKEAENRRMREIAQLKKESRKNANMIRSMEAERKVSQLVLKRKQEEVSALRRHQRDNLSNKAAGRKGNKLGPKAAKQKWLNVEKSVNKLAMSKQVIVEQELRMEQLIHKRESLSSELQKLHQKRVTAEDNHQDTAVLDSLIDDIHDNINYIQETISETQHSVMEIEESQETNEATDIQQIVQSVFDIDEARYLIQKLFNMTVNQSHSVAQKDAKIKESEANLAVLQQENSVKAQLLDHMLHTDQTMFLHNSMTASLSSNANESSSNTSSRSISPVDNLLTENHKPNKIRKKTALPAELLFGVKNSSDLMTQSQDSSSLRQENPIQRVPSAPGSLKGLLPLPTRRPSPRLMHRLPLSTSAKHGSMDQGLDLVSPSPPGSPVAYRRATSREDNVFNRLTAPVDSQQTSKGRIVPYNGKNPAKSLLQCVSIAEGHNNGVLSLCTTEDMMVTGAADRTVKLWDLNTGTEKQTLGPHPNNVVAVRFNPVTNLLLSASSSYVKVWDVRQSSAKCIKVLCSSGLTQSASSLSATRSVQIALGESQVNDTLFNKVGNLICTAASDKVRVWDIRKLSCIGKLSGGHQAAVMCLAVGHSRSKNDLIVTGSKDHYIKVFELDATPGGNFSPTMNLEPPHYDGIQSLVVDDNVLFSGSRDMCIKKWDLERHELTQSLNNAHKGWICGLTVMNRGRLLVSGCRAGYLKIWDAHSCDLQMDMKAHNSAINSIASNSQLIMTASNCGEVKIWRLAMD